MDCNMLSTVPFTCLVHYHLITNRPVWSENHQSSAVRRVQVCWGRRYNVSVFLYVFPSSNTHDTCDMAFLFSQWLEYVPPYAHQPNALCHLSSSNLAMIVGIPDQNRTYMSLLLQTPPHLKQGNKKCCFHVLSLTANTFLYVHKTLLFNVI